MSDQSDDNKDPESKAVEPEASVEASAEADASSSWNPATDPPRKPAAKPASKSAQKKGSSAVAWFALLLIIVLAAGAAWSLREGLRRESVLAQRLATLESVKSSQQDVELAALTELTALDKRLQGNLQSGLAKVESTSAAQAAQLEQLEAAVTIQREEIARFGATDRKDWLLAEAEYLLRLANQRLIMAGDVVAATTLLSSADSILLELDEATLHTARAAVAADLAALRALPKVDTAGLYLRLAALIEQVDQLAIFQLPDRAEAVDVASAEGWQDRLQQGYEQALYKLSEYIVVRRRDVPYEALMDPQWERLVRQNMRMLLEQAQVALLSGNQQLFEESLGRTSHWVEQFFEVDEAGSRAISQDIAGLKSETIEVDIPDVSRSLRELDQAMERRLQLESGE
ncbi:MAG: uroporphyrinogen-III C-methyltransferase [Halioglobus sp.]